MSKENKTLDKQQNGNDFIADVMRSFLKENLAIQISTSIERDYGDEYTVIEVSISLDGEEICKSSDSVR